MTTNHRKRINPLVLPESTDLPEALIGALYAFRVRQLLRETVSYEQHSLHLTEKPVTR